MPVLEISLDESLYEALKQKAEQLNQPIEVITQAALAIFLESPYKGDLVVQDADSPGTKAADDADKIHAEVEAWRAMPEIIRKQYGDQFVAVHEGQIIDHDPDRLQLYRRISQKLGNIPVLITPASAPSPRVFTIRGPRLERPA